MNITIGKRDGLDFTVDLDRLISTRLLIQANSGGGKSYLIRKILEESHGKVQHIVLDLEGEFSTMRSKYDYILAGKDGDIDVNVKNVPVLIKRILQYNISIIIDLYELKHHERIVYVRKFLESMINVKKELWKPCLVIIDEAHIFCPEKAKAESGAAVIDLCTRGRKRGFCAVLATQRLSKLNKDAAAECNNKLR
jgi:DNA helicase HerA-like ATPase